MNNDDGTLQREDQDQRFRRAHAELKTVAVTGTNGKTTTTTMLASIVEASGELAALLTTLGAAVAQEPICTDSLADEFLRTVERAVERGVCTLALEVTSKALAGGIAQRWRPTVAVFTNLSRDHLDMHRSAEEYLAAKAQLFMALPDDGVAVLNGDDPSSELIAALLPDTVVARRFSVRDSTADLAATAVCTSAAGTRVELAASPLASRLNGVLELSVAGDVHAQNALAAALAADALGYPADAIARGLRNFRGVTGRFQVIARTPLVVVDYAHTPDGLDGTLVTARNLVGDAGKILCVFGCGGNRDRGKRPLMGAAVDRLADVAILTNDNPRHEDPEQIAADIRKAAESPRARWHLELDRRAAIEYAVRCADREDIVVIAGKGHETEQEIAGQMLEFSDVDVARSACRAANIELAAD